MPRHHLQDPEGSGRSWRACKTATELQSRMWHLRYSRPENALGRVGALDLVRALGRSIRLVCCRRRAAKGIEVREEARAPTNSRHLRAGSSPTLGPPASKLTFAPPSWRGFFLWGRATKKNPERLSARGFARSCCLSVGFWSGGVGGGACRSAEPLCADIW
jgi:hypothetical protein